jgi:hypothetical protein
MGLLAISIPHGVEAVFAPKAAAFRGEDERPERVRGVQSLSDFEQPPDSRVAAVSFKTSYGFPRVERFGSAIIDLAEWHGGC